MRSLLFIPAHFFWPLERVFSFDFSAMEGKVLKSSNIFLSRPIILDAKHMERPRFFFQDFQATVSRNFQDADGKNILVVSSDYFGVKHSR